MTLLNVLIGAERPVSLERIRQKVPGYTGEAASFQRQFERDKKALRDMGLDVEVLDIPGAYPPEVGYRIRRDQAYLRDPGLAPDELAAIALAASAVRLDGIEGSGGLWKLGGAPPPESGDGIIDLPADPRLVGLFEAVAERRTTTFTYRGAVRSLEPWRLDCVRGRWYVTGHDRDRGESRHFRLDRIEGEIDTGPAAAFERPVGTVEGVRMEAWQFGAGPAQTAEVLVDADQRDALLQASPTATLVDDRPDGSGVITFEVTDPDAFRTLVLTHLEHVEVLAPPALRADLVQWLEGIIERAGR
jgi:predicted DNA-binding transcriptional regulator YafY